MKRLLAVVFSSLGAVFLLPALWLGSLSAKGAPSCPSPPNGCSSVSPLGWTQPVRAVIVSGFRTASRPGHDGVDLGAPRGTTIVAAAAGIVTRVRCDVEPSSWGCDRDGHPVLVKGCGWYVDLEHIGGLITRYCHMESRPLVSVGEHVDVGQPLGVVGSSGHSSGPHLHYEVHRNQDHSSVGAIDPEEHMTSVGAPLGRRSS